MYDARKDAIEDVFSVNQSALAIVSFFLPAQPSIQPSSTTGVTHNVRLPRRRRPASYSAQFLTLNFILGICWRRPALCLFGMEGGQLFRILSKTTRFQP